VRSQGIRIRGEEPIDLCTHLRLEERLRDQCDNLVSFVREDAARPSPDTRIFLPNVTMATASIWVLLGALALSIVR